MKRRHLNILREVLALPTAPFREEAAQAWLRGWAEGLSLPCRQDEHGNLLIGRRRGDLERGHRPWVFAAHMDHPGFVATRQTGSVVWGRFYGGVGMRYFAGAAMDWHVGGEVLPADVEAASRRRTPLPHYVVRTRLRRLGRVPTDALGMWRLPAFRLSGSRVSARACDDLAGLAMAVCALEDWARSDRPGAAWLLASRAEEVGLLGAVGACRGGLIPAGAVVLSLETSSGLAGRVKQGDGVIVRVGDRTSLFDPDATQTLCDAAAELARRGRGFRWQRALMPGGTCEASAYAAYGHTAAAVCLALGNYHNCGPRRIAAETIDLRDFAAGVRLLTALTGRSAAGGQGTLRQRLDELWRIRGPLLR